MNGRKFGRLGRLWQHAGLWCVMVEPYYGRRSGYVRIPDKHPWHGLGYSDSLGEPIPVEDWPLAQSTWDDPRTPFAANVAALFGTGDEFLSTMQSRVAIHGGLTFAAERSATDWDTTIEGGDGVPGGWWIGFDCGHAGDADDLSIMSPKARAIAEKYPPFPGDVVRTAVYVIDECERLAEQVAEAGRVPA